MAEVVEVLDDLTEEQARTVNHWSATLEELDTGIPDRITSLRTAVFAVLPGIEMLDQHLRHDASKAGRGRPKNVRAHDIADRLAIAFALGTGDRPTYGRAPNTNSPSTAFGRSLAAVLEAVGVPVGDVPALAKNAVESCTQAALEGAREQNRGYFQRIRNRRISMFDVLLVEKLGKDS